MVVGQAQEGNKGAWNEAICRTHLSRETQSLGTLIANGLAQRSDPTCAGLKYMVVAILKHDRMAIEIDWTSLGTLSP
jgi:hypothetical protein